MALRCRMMIDYIERPDACRFPSLRSGSWYRMSLTALRVAWRPSPFLAATWCSTRRCKEAGPPYRYREWAGKCHRRNTASNLRGEIAFSASSRRLRSGVPEALISTSTFAPLRLFRGISSRKAGPPGPAAHSNRWFLYFVARCDIRGLLQSSFPGSLNNRGSVMRTARLSPLTMRRVRDFQSPHAAQNRLVRPAGVCGCLLRRVGRSGSFRSRFSGEIFSASAS